MLPEVAYKTVEIYLQLTPQRGLSLCRGSCRSFRSLDLIGELRFQTRFLCRKRLRNSVRLSRARLQRLLHA